MLVGKHVTNLFVKGFECHAHTILLYTLIIRSKCFKVCGGEILVIAAGNLYSSS